jgi:hypothetical protein
MANDEHVALLKQGVNAWNAWRDENTNIRPNPPSSLIRSAPQSVGRKVPLRAVPGPFQNANQTRYAGSLPCDIMRLDSAAAMKR